MKSSRAWNNFTTFPTALGMNDSSINEYIKDKSPQNQLYSEHECGCSPSWTDLTDFYSIDREVAWQSQSAHFLLKLTKKQNVKNPANAVKLFYMEIYIYMPYLNKHTLLYRVWL